MSVRFDALPELVVANDALGDRDRLDALLARHGYLFFRDVLDIAAVTQARNRVIATLAEMGVVDAGQDRAIWNGADLARFPAKVETLYKAGIWQELVACPSIRAFYETVVGRPIAWIPLSGFRTTPPSASDPDDPFVGRHQDGFMNGDIPYLTCWIPLDAISHETGGLALADGLNHCGYLHNLADPPRFQIPRESIPDTAWRSTAYRPGDTVMFDHRIPHAGLPNRSNAFRLSLDVRLMPAGHPLIPLVGEIVSLAPDAAVVACEGGRRTVRFDDDTYFRAKNGTRLAFVEVEPFLTPGTEVMIGHKEGVVTMIKPVE